MKTALINASPKEKRSASGTLFTRLQMYMGKEKIERYSWSGLAVKEDDLESVLGCDTMVIAYPLYVDGIPSNLLSCLEQVQEFLERNPREGVPKVFVIVNNGSYEPRQSRISVEMVENWCFKTGFDFAGALCVGAGGMIVSEYNSIGENGPFMRVNECLREVGDMIKSQEFKGEIKETTPALTKSMYKIASHRGWIIRAKKNGLSEKELGS